MFHASSVYLLFREYDVTSGRYAPLGTVYSCVKLGWTNEMLILVKGLCID